MTLSGRGSIHILHRKNKSVENGPLAIKKICRLPANFLGFTVELIYACIHCSERDDCILTKYLHELNCMPAPAHFMSTKIQSNGVDNKAYWHFFWLNLLDHLLCNLSHSDPHLCSGKLIRKFIRFLWNPLSLLQTPQNLIKTTTMREKLHFTWAEFYVWHYKREGTHTTHPLKGEDPAASSYAQQNVEGASVASRHHVSCALADLVNNRKTTQCFHDLANDVLLPIGEGHIMKQSIKNND